MSKYDEIRARRARGEKGFTLIELLVVVVILGILIAIAIPVYLNYQNNAKKKSLESDVRAAVSSVEQCISDNGGSFDTTACAGTFNSTSHGTAPYIINTSDGNELVVAENAADGGYTITGTRSDPTYQSVYTSATGQVVNT